MKKILAFCLTLSCLCTNGWAHEVYGLNVSVMAGPGFDVDGHLETLPIFGASSAYLLKNNLEFGAEVGIRGTVFTLGVDGNYFLTSGLFIGLQGGLDFSTETSSFIGPQVGYDFEIRPGLFVGPEVQYLFSVGHYADIFETLLTLKYFLP